MPENIDVLNQALDKFNIMEEGFVWSEAFVSLLLDLKMNLQQEDRVDRKTRTHLESLDRDIMSISIIVSRLDWLYYRAFEDEYVRSFWIYYAAVDIEHFHTKFRSILDHVAYLIKWTAIKPGQSPESFSKLLTWLPKRDHGEVVGEDIARIVEPTRLWFDGFCDVRDEIVHRSALTLAYPQIEEGILFQVHSGFRRMVLGDLIMFNDNVAYFDRYVAVYFSQLIIFLDSVMLIIRDRRGISKEHGGEMFALGFGVIRKWIENFITLFEERERTQAAVE